MKINCTKLLIGFTISSTVMCCTAKKEEQPEATPKICVSDTMVKLIKIDSAINTRISSEIKLSGEVAFDENKIVKVFPFSSGKIISSKVSLGDRVQQGQVLAIIKSADVAGNYSDFSTSQNDIAITKKQMDNAESLYKNGIASQREYIEAKEAYKKALTASSKVKFQIDINGGGHTNAQGNYVVTSPITGYVVEKKVNEGAFIRGDNSDNIFTIGNTNDVWVWGYVYESDIQNVKEGYAVEVTTIAYPDKVFNGYIDKVNQTLDPATGVMKVRIKLSNTNQLLKPEMFANILVKNTQGQDAIAIPASAIITDNGKSFVVIYNGNCDLKVQEIEVDKTIGTRAYIKSGIAVGQKVISQNQLLFFKALTEE